MKALCVDDSSMHISDVQEEQLNDAWNGLKPFRCDALGNDYLVLGDMRDWLFSKNQLMSHLCGKDMYGPAFILRFTNDSNELEYIGLGVADVFCIKDMMQRDYGVIWEGYLPGENIGLKPFYYVYSSVPDAPWSLQDGYTMVLADSSAAAFLAMQIYHPNDIATPYDYAAFSNLPTTNIGPCVDIITLRREIPPTSPAMKGETK